MNKDRVGGLLCLNGFHVDLASASADCIGQGPISGLLTGSERLPDVIQVTRPFGRFGNNFIQAINAYTIAKSLGMTKLQLCNLGGLSILDADLEGIRISDTMTDENALAGCFYAPYGFESVFSSITDQNFAKLLSSFVNVAYANLHREYVAGRSYLAAHFRSGDIFLAGHPVSPSYVQPPFAYYALAIEHVWQSGHFDHVELVYEDRANPAIALTERFLASVNIPFVSRSLSFEEDLARLLGAACIVASVSTLCEAVVLLSKQVKSYYSFRDHSSQSEFAPFMQARISSILFERGIEGWIIDDMTKCYTPKWQWCNSPAQRDFIANYDIRGLRIFKG